MFLLLAFSVTLGAVTAMTHSQIEGYTVTKTDTIDYSPRMKRSSISFVRAFLKSMGPATYQNKIKVVVKTGGIKQAHKDFQSLKPTKTLETGHTKYGRVGPINVILRTPPPPYHPKLEFVFKTTDVNGKPKWIEKRIVYED